MSASPPQARTTGPQVGVRTIALMLRALRSIGADVPAILERAGLDEAVLDDLDTRLPEERVRSMWRAAEEITSDPDMGLHMGERVTVGDLDVVGYLVRATSDGMEAAQRAAELVRLFADGFEITFRQDGGRLFVCLEWRPQRNDSRALEEFVAVMSVVVPRELVGDSVQPVEVHFRHARPDDISEHQRIFGAPLRFGMPETALVFETAGVPTVIPTADARLSEILERHARQLLEQLPPVDDFVARVRWLISQELAGGDPSAEHIAERLGMSVRTLRRRLEESGAGHKALLDKLRHELALRYLGEQRLEIGEVAYLLGFSEPSAFHRAFKRWTGKTPAEVRSAAQTRNGEG